MATGAQFNTALAARITPVRVLNMRGETGGLKYTLSDGRQIDVKRQRVKSATAQQLSAYVIELVG